VLEQSFFELTLPERSFEGIFANASLFHVPRLLLPRVLGTLHDALTPRGVLFCSNPRGFARDEEGWSGGRYGCFLTIDSWKSEIAAAGFQIEHAYLRPSDRPPEAQPWLAMVCRKGPRP
jgi:SAM-dependent methyltransferase